MTALWTTEELVAATGGTARGAVSAGSGLAIDSRTVAPGDLFIALRGENFDGHDFTAKALAAGAAAAMVDHIPADVPADAPLLVVGDTLDGLTALGRAARRRTRARIVGVTGSVGKTGSKEALRLALSGLGATHASASSFNNHWGLPLSLARMPRDAEYGVLELGMNHAGELEALSLVARPHVAIITNVEAAHLGFFPSVEAIADAKAEIFAGIEPDGAAVLNRDNPHFARLRAAAFGRGIAHILAFGSDAKADIRLLDCTLGPTSSMVTASIMGARLRYTIGQPGRHWVLNSLGVLAVVAALGADVVAAAGALAGLPGLPGRGQRRTLQLNGGAVEFIDESYNANPASMRAALAVLAATTPAPTGRRVAVIGTMRELGPSAEALHVELAAPILASRAELVLTCGTDMAGLRAALPARILGPHRDTAAELAPLVVEALRPGDVVMIKGSLGTRMADIVKPLLAASGAAGGTGAPKIPSAAAA